jgi:hypothetical protein
VGELVARLLLDGPRRQAELTAALRERGLPRSAFAGAQLWVDLVRVPPAGTWERPRAHVYGLARQWLGRAAPDDSTETAAQVQAGEELLAERYLRGFGPASAADLARFGGLTTTAARAVLARMDLRRFRDEAGGELFDLPVAPLPAADTPAPVRFLSNFDAALLLGHARRAGIVPDEHRDKVFHSSMPQSVPTFLVDGRVAGTWRAVAGRVEWQPFAPLPATVARQVDEEARRLAAFVGD